jgi:hypothetical protein
MEGIIMFSTLTLVGLIISLVLLLYILYKGLSYRDEEILLLLPIPLSLILLCSRGIVPIGFDYVSTIMYLSILVILERGIDRE